MITYSCLSTTSFSSNNGLYSTSATTPESVLFYVFQDLYMLPAFNSLQFFSWTLHWLHQPQFCLQVTSRLGGVVQYYPPLSFFLFTRSWIYIEWLWWYWTNQVYVRVNYPMNTSPLPQHGTTPTTSSVSGLGIPPPPAAAAAPSEMMMVIHPDEWLYHPRPSICVFMCSWPSRTLNNRAILWWITTTD